MNKKIIAKYGKRTYTDTMMIQELSKEVIEFLEERLTEYGIQSSYHRMTVLQHAISILTIVETSENVIKAIQLQADLDEESDKK